MFITLLQLRRTGAVRTPFSATVLDAAMQDFEKLGAFYLGRLLDEKQESRGDELLLYDAKDLTTHALCVGMTGSGKTGLCVGLLEEAAIDGIPAIVIDPKGDIGNLLLTFPELRAEDFRPWIDESEAARKGVTADVHAENTAAMWRKGLAEWGQDGARIRHLRESVDMAIYTPGSSAGLPLSLLRSFDAPPVEQRTDLDAMRDRILSTVSGLLALLGIDADPIQSREHILLSNILDHEWREGRNLEIAGVIQGILAPPFDKLGVFDLESFYPEKDRRALAMQLNNVLASPSFAAWMQGEALDVGKLLYTADGKPRISVLSIAHLSDAERMFFVTLLLNETVTWMRRQAGTSSLRAILYMDEIYGYFPPSAEPPSKKPMLTLLKQARAFGLGCVLATQNPVDLDYKGLGNTGTWFIGRLQTERDKLRVLDGLEGASTSAGQSFDRARIDETISGLGKRVFLMNNVHDDAPVLFSTRWVLSYLRGPLTREHIETLMSARKAAATAAPADATGTAPASTSVTPAASVPAPTTAADKPILSTAADEVFLRAEKEASGDGRLLYHPQLYTTAQLHFVDAKAKLDEWKALPLLAPIPEDRSETLWDEARLFDAGSPAEHHEGEAHAEYGELPAAVANEKNFTAWEKSLKDWLYRNYRVTLWSCPDFKAISTPGESEGDFRVRVSQLLHEQRDLEMEKLRNKYQARFTRVQEKIRKAEERVDREEAQFKEQTLSTAVSIGSTLLGALLGRRGSTRSTINRTASSVNRASRAVREKQDIARAKDDVVAANAELIALEDSFRDEASKIKGMDVNALRLEEIQVSPRKSDIGVAAFTIAWVPRVIGEDGRVRSLL
jgi:hypothetical protein